MLLHPLFVLIYLFLISVHALVLVAHNGSAFDFPILFAEVERRSELATLNFPNNFHFCDTLPVLWKVKILIIAASN